MSDCSRCPVLDLGKPYPAGDPQSPWRRMPVTFTLLRGLFGASFYNPNGRTRRSVERALSLHCVRTRDRYGEPCPDARIRLCARLALDALGPCCDVERPYALVNHRLATMADSESAAGALAATRLKPNPSLPLAALDEPQHTR